MSVITFWNDSKNGNIGQTSSLIATATLMAVEHNYKILLISTQLGDLDLDYAFGVSESGAAKFLGLKEVKFNSGIEGIMKLANSGKLTPNMIGNFTKIVLKDRLEVVAGKKEIEDEDSDKFDFNDYVDVIKIANNYYDMVFVDLDRSLEADLTRRILNASNLIVWNMEPKLKEIMRAEELQSKEEIVNGDNVVYLLNKYEKNSKYNVKNIMRTSKMKKNVYTVPYDLMYSDALQDGVVDGWMLNPKIRKATLEDEHGFFVTQVKSFCEGITYKLQELSILGK